MKKMAHIIDGTVVQVSKWDGVSPWADSANTVEIPAGSRAGIGWDYVDGAFVDNRPVDDDDA